MRAAYGAQVIKDGNVYFKGEDVTGNNIKDMIGRGFSYAPPDRRVEGLFKKN